MPDDRPKIVTVTCHTSGCDAAGIAIDLASESLVDGDWFPVDSYWCGTCSHEITDVTDAAAPATTAQEGTTP